MKRLKGFTLIELLVVVAIIALLISILLPSLSRARELSKRTVCGANMHGLGHALYLYAGDSGPFPYLSDIRTNNDGAVTFFAPADRTTQPSSTGTPSPTVDLWLLVREGNTSVKQLICPSTVDLPDPAQDPSFYWDFYKNTNLSYAYQYQHDPDRPPIGTSSEPIFPVIADSNPYIKGMVVPNDPVADRTSFGKGNSTNHTNREGEYVLFQDGHGTFEKSPDVGIPGLATMTGSRGRDNCYSLMGNAANAPVDPGAAAPTSTLCNLAGKSDACLVP